jgi:hypothetical protein
MLTQEISLLIRSADRDSGAGSHSFTKSLNFGLQGRFLVAHAIIPATAYSVQTGYNDTIYFDEGGPLITCTIPQGNYTTTTIATAVGTAMTAATLNARTYTAAVSTLTEVMTITGSSNFSLRFATGVTATARTVLGYAAADTTAATTAVGGSVVNLGGPVSLNIGVTEAKSGSFYVPTPSREFRGQILVPMVVGSGFYQTLVPRDLPQIVEFDQPARVLHITVTDSGGNLINLNGGDWQLLLRKVHTSPEAVRAW